MNSETQTETIQLLHFKIQETYACLNLKIVKKILPLLALEKIPESPDYLVGLLNFAGESVPVIDLAWRLNLMNHARYNLDTPIILCDNGTNVAGLIVDNIVGITSVSKQKLQKKKEFQESSSPFLAAVEIDSNLALLINPDIILNVTFTESRP